MKTNRLSKPVRVLVFVCGIALALVIFLPIWRIELSAPQYPEGLVLQIFANKLAGDVEIVNGLNHYIGMRTLHEEDFVEFKILPYIIGFFAILCIIIAAINRRKGLIIVTSLFIVFAILAMVDFWKWEYDYGHNLDPTAPIQVPGMSYQPPLIGYKLLLNFGAYSIPDIGGWIFVAVGLTLFISMIVEIRKNKKNKKAATGQVAAMALLLFFASCNAGPQPIKVGFDNCQYCKMTIADNRFGAEIVTQKGKAYKFDDVHCLLAFQKSGEVKKEDVKQVYFTDYNGTHDLIDKEKALLLKSEQLKSPMGGNVAAFSQQKEFDEALQRNNGQAVKWEALEQNK